MVKNRYTRHEEYLQRKEERRKKKYGHDEDEFEGVKSIAVVTIVVMAILLTVKWATLHSV